MASLREQGAKEVAATLKTFYFDFESIESHGINTHGFAKFVKHSKIMDHSYRPLTNVESNQLPPQTTVNVEYGFNKRARRKKWLQNQKPFLLSLLSDMASTSMDKQNL